MKPRALRRYAASSFSALAVEQKHRLGLSVRDLARSTGLAPVTLYKALQEAEAARPGSTRQGAGAEAPSPDRGAPAGGVSTLLAVLFAQDLKIDIVHATLLAARDSLRDLVAGLRDEGGRKMPGPRRGDGGVSVAKLDRAIDDLDAALAWQTSIYAAAGTQRRLAFRQHRMKHGCSRSDVAKVMRAIIAAEVEPAPGATPPESVGSLARELWAYESGRLAFDDDHLRRWVVALGVATGEPITGDALEKLGQDLLMVHEPHLTADVQPLRAAKPMLVELPPGAELTLERSQTVHGPIAHEVLRYTSAAEGSDGWVLNARHAGFECATVAEGGPVRLVLSSRAVASSSDLLSAGVIEKDVEVAPGHSVAFPSGRWHHARFSGPRASVVSWNHSGNLFLHRRYGKPQIAP